MTTNYWVKMHSVEIVKKLEQKDSVDLPTHMLDYFRSELMLCEEILTGNIKDFKTKGNYSLRKLVSTRNFVSQITDEVIDRM